MFKSIFSSRNRLAWIGIAVISIVAISIGTRQLISIREEREVLLPAIPAHADIPLQPKLTYLDSLKLPFPSDSQALKASGCNDLSPTWLQSENAKTGVAMTVKDWHDLHLFLPTGSVLWTSQVSATCGDVIKVHASMLHGATNAKGQEIQVWRIGYYGGSEARQVWGSGPLTLKRYNIPGVRTITRMVETKWPVTTKFTIGKDWTPGLYAVATINSTGAIENMAPLIVKAAVGSSKLLLVHSTITWAAYNTFGGRSAYTGPVNAARERSRVVSMDRPLIGSGINHFDRDAIALVQFLEEKGIKVDQIADTDLDRNPTILTHYSGVIFSGHPEYMTNRIFKSILAGRNNGINFAFLGSNNAYWQVRLEPSPSGSDRHIAIYRDPLTDPITSPEKISIQFDNPRINMFPSLITGETTSGVHVVGEMKVVNMPSWLNIPITATLSGWSPNTEIDSMVTGKLAPTNLHLIFSGKFSLTRLAKSTPSKNARISSRNYLGQTIWYTTPSGSAVFMAGVNYWACELSYTCYEENVNAETRSTLQNVTQQVLNLWQTKAIGRKLH